jgi:NADH-quinone oxidoreductase subunit N
VSAHLDAVTFTTPSVEYRQLMPMLVVLGAATVGIVAEALLPRRSRYPIQAVLSIGAVIAAFVLVVTLHGKNDVVAEGAVAIDGPTLFMQGTVLLITLLTLLLVAERGVGAGGTDDAFTAQPAAVPGSEHEWAAIAAGHTTTEVFPLVLFAAGGMMLFPASNDLLTMFVALEVLSLPLYLLCGLARRRRLLSQEAAMKYFLLGSMSSAFFLYGVALLYGYAGTLSLSGIAKVVGGTSTAGSHNDALLLIGTALLGVGLLFKVGAVPFHAWTPDVYQGAPTPVTGFMAAATKIAAFGALLRVLYVGLPGARWDWRPVIWGVALLSMVIGAVIAITQQDIKRMLAYSAILNAGYVLLGVLSANSDGVSSTLFFLLTYGFAMVGAFAVVTLVRDSGGEATHLSRWAGLGRRSPLLASVFALFLLAFAGIPLTSVFAGKFALFQAAAAGGAVPLVIVAVVASAVAAFFYVRVIVLMFFSAPAADGPTVAVPSGLTVSAITLAAAATLVLGVYPQLALGIADHASTFVFG